MISILDNIPMDEMSIPYDSQWEEGDYRGLLMHSIHAYPAKFPPFIATKAFKYAEQENVQIHNVADIFCGCGTTALEAKKRGFSFWGCDINPVATMITSAKVADYEVDLFRSYYERIIEESKKIQKNNFYEAADERLKYWYSSGQYNALYRLLSSIKYVIPETDSVSLTGYYCIFSSILKKCSRWLQKSIKPQIDPEKKEVDVFKTFAVHYNNFVKAIEECKDISQKGISIDIKLDNFLDCNHLPEVDLIVTSPPYVTSYEYADLHQLSSLWLSYSRDYKTLRTGTIGSGYNYNNCCIDNMNLNQTATEIVTRLKDSVHTNSKVIPVARYYSDMQRAVQKCFDMLRLNGMALYVIGDSELKGVALLNSTHLVETMKQSGFSDLKVGKRTISKGICVPYRDRKGRFTQNKSNSNHIYHEEYIISGRKL